MTETVSDKFGSKLDILSSLALGSNESSSSLSEYSVQLLLLVGLSLKECNKDFNDDVNKGIGISVKPLTLEPRPPMVESSENIKTYTTRFGTNGFISRNNRNIQRGRMSGGSISGITRSIIRQSDDNLWDMPCSDMGNLTLGDIREAESKMKAEDITLDQYVERQKEFIIKRGPASPSQNRRTNNFNQTFGVDNTSNNSSNVQRLFSGKNQHQPNFLDSVINSKNNQKSNIQSLNASKNSDSDVLPDKFVENTSKRVISVIPSASNRKLSTFSGDFLKGPANLSLFDMNTPIFDDDCNDSVDFYTPNVNSVNNTINRENPQTVVSNSSRVAEILSTRAAVTGTNTIASHTNLNATPTTNNSSANVSATTATASNFSWSNRVVNHNDTHKNNANLANLSASFPALSKNTQINQTPNRSNILGGNQHSPQLDSNNILHRLQAAAGLSSRLSTGNNLNNNNINISTNNDGSGNVYNSKYNQQTHILRPNSEVSNEYPPLSSASNVGLCYSSHSVIQQKNNQVKTNDAGRLLMSIIGAGQHKNDDDKNSFGGYSKY
ncbi:hypothetical protein FG379_001661 [Cryptosporidium bovis]|uniref:uncharacterized protein n=1 Tax=Cryptosporidium bovis TaxID=310047 RepID=UPI00351A3F3C|nr:hypothetical protein FG379_001661 [Cryptosporidium bovis]